MVMGEARAVCKKGTNDIIKATLGIRPRHAAPSMMKGRDGPEGGLPD